MYLPKHVDTPIWVLRFAKFLKRPIFTTIEGIGTTSNPDPIQEAFAQQGAGQCGYCIPGTVIAVKALLAKNPQPTRAQILDGLSNNLCRCGAHHDVVKAVENQAFESN